MNTCIFLGPTLPHAQASEILDAVYLPPAAQGDVFMAVNDGAEILGIVDGYFQQVPSVWHKEILWALSEGVHVFGAASMGALRAAELHTFGMRGVGSIFELFRDKVLIDDDEVAIVHAPEEVGFTGGTTPLVDIRATLQRACEKSIIEPVLHDELLAAAQSLPYWQRTYDNLFDAHGQLPLKTRLWISTHAVQQKREDAIAMLEAILQVADAPMRVDFCFHHTMAFENLVIETRARTSDSGGVLQDDDDAVLDELRLAPQLFEQIAEPNILAGGETQCSLPSGWFEQLRSLGVAEEIQCRAHAKQRWLHERFGGLPEYADVMMTPAFVFDWHFEQCNGVPVPSDVERYASSRGYAGVESLSRTLLHEYLFANAAV